MFYSIVDFLNYKLNYNPGHAAGAKAKILQKRL
jgi:hypothetical protein